jgi:hypothetical protein
MAGGVLVSTESTTTETPAAVVRPTRYEVSCVPEDNVNARHFTLKVEYRGRGLWAVTDGIDCLNEAGKWSYERIPSSREDDWLATHRFDLDAAFKLAKEAAPKMTVNGYTVAHVLARHEARKAGQ